MLKNSHAIARISTPVDPTKEAVGTGFIVENTAGTDDITFLTNAHVVAPGNLHYVELAWCKPQKIPATVIAICYDKDMSLIAVSRESWNQAVDEYVHDEGEKDFLKRAEPLELGTKSNLATFGTEVCCQGHPLGLPDQQYSWGKTRGVYNMPDGSQRILIQAPINHGNSGGPVFTNDETNRVVVGISTMKLSGEAVEGEGGIITVMEMQSVLPSMMEQLKPKKLSNTMISALLDKLKKMGLSVVNVEEKMPHTEKAVQWLSENYDSFNKEWNELAIGGRVNGTPRNFKAWFNRHIVRNGEFMYNGQKILTMVLKLASEGRMSDLEPMRSSWRETRLGAEKKLVSVNLNDLQGHVREPVLLHAPILGFTNLQSIQNVDFREYYNPPDSRTHGVIVNTVLPKSLYAKASGREGDLIYAFTVKKIKDGNPIEVLYDKKYLDKSGKFTDDNTSLGTRISLSAALHHLPWESNNNTRYDVTCHVLRAMSGEPNDITFTMASPSKEDLPLMKKVIPFNNETNNQYGCRLNGLTLAQCNENYIEKLQLTEYLDVASHYTFKVICLNSQHQKIMPGSTLIKLNGEDMESCKSWDEFCAKLTNFEKSLQQPNPPKYWTATFARPGFKCKVINKC